MNKMSMGESQPQNLFEITPDQANALFDYHPDVLPIIFPRIDSNFKEYHLLNAKITELIEVELSNRKKGQFSNLIASLREYYEKKDWGKFNSQYEILKDILETIFLQILKKAFNVPEGNLQAELSSQWQADLYYLQDGIYKNTYCTYTEEDIPAEGIPSAIAQILEATGYIFEHNNKKYIKKVFIKKALELIVLTITSESNELSENIKTLLLKKEDSLSQLLTGQSKAVKFSRLYVWRRQHEDRLDRISSEGETLPAAILDELIGSLLGIDGIAREDVEKYLENDQILGRFKNQIITAFNEGQTKFSKTA